VDARGGGAADRATTGRATTGTVAPSRRADLDHPDPPEVVCHRVSVLSGRATRSYGLWSGYGALSAPAPELGPAVGRTVSLLLHLTVPAYRTNLPVLGHPGWYAYTVAEHPELTVRARHSRPDGFVVACAAVSAPRGLYLGGAGGRPDRIGRIIADGLLTAVGASRPEPNNGPRSSSSTRPPAAIWPTPVPPTSSRWWRPRPSGWGPTGQRWSTGGTS